MPGSSSRLTALQQELLQAFFDRTQSFFLSGGGALAGYYLWHRETKHLDLFATPEIDIQEGVRVLRSSAQSIGAIVEVEQEYPDFRRFRVLRTTELTLVDLAIDRAPQLVSAKPTVGSIRLDALNKIAANKVCALLGRAEVRDLIDLKELADRGHSITEMLAQARLKEGGVEPAVLAWVLDELQIGPRSPLPPDVNIADLDQFRRRLVVMLTAIAHAETA